MTHYQLYPNLHTFGCLAMGCLRRDDGLKLLDDMKVSVNIKKYIHITRLKMPINEFTLFIVDP